MRVLVSIVLLAIAASASADDDTLVAHVIDIDIDRIPSVTVAPKYPRKARRDRVEGQVQVCFDIDREGRTRRIAVRHSTNRTFERPSIKAVRKSTFQRLKAEETLQSLKSCRTFVFSLVPIAD